ncbi:MAG: calcium/sodium antiporter [Ardenticatenaceae bacterium]|nr:calcium/sodium antiporter [Ardenticatenaceae bacterium]
MVILLFIAGLVFLVVGAELLVGGASRLAAAIGISPLIIGLTVVAFGTSSPELAVSIKAAYADQASIAVGNVVGSNIFNVLFILGLSAIVAPLIVSKQLIRLDVPLMIGASVLMLLLGLDGRLGRLDGILMFGGLLAYIWFLIVQGRKEASNESEYEQALPAGARQWLQTVGKIVIGLGLLVLGSQWLVDSAVAFAHYLGVSELVIGLTIVAAGTSLPELMTSVVASLRGERDIAVGNVVGSNLFNILGVMGLASIVSPSGIEIQTAVLRFDIPIMIAVALMCLPIFFTGGIIARWEGALLFGYQIAYTLYLILAASQHQSLATFGTIMLIVIVPLTIIALGVTTFQAWQQRHQAVA